MLQRVVPVDRLEGVLSPPGDKSISHRAILLNALDKGPARITNCSTSIDGEATVACIRKPGILAYHSHSEPSVVTVEGAEGLLWGAVDVAGLGKQRYHSAIAQWHPSWPILLFSGLRGPIAAISSNGPHH